MVTYFKPLLYCRLNLLITHIGQHTYQSLSLPVFQHLSDDLPGYVCTLHGNALLQSLLKGESNVQTLEDGVISATSGTIISSLTAIALR